MATKRQLLEDRIKRNEATIAELQSENLELYRKTLLLSDKTQWYVEKIETLGRGKSKRLALVGRIHWKEQFFDQDKPDDSIWIERTKAVKVGGEWI